MARCASRHANQVIFIPRLQGFLEGVSATDPLVYAAAAFLLLAVTLGAAAVPALRAARTDPLVSLRE